MAGKAEFTFDPKAFLATVGPGHTVSDLRKNEVVFLQSAAADAVFYIQEGNIKGFGSRGPVTMDDFGERAGLFSRIVEHPEVVITQANSHRALGETSPQILQRFTGLLCTRQIARHDEGIRTMLADPLSNLQ